jgi:FkbM family methyltransferase
MAHILKKLRVALTPRSSLLWTELDNGTTIAGYNRPGFGGRGVYIYGDSLEPELSSLQYFLKPDFVVIDVGANVGVYTLKAAREIGPSGLVIAVEPFLETAYQLSNNIRANGYRNIRIRNLCISQKTEEAQLYLNRGAPNSFGLFPEDEADSISVLAVSLDDLCRWEGLKRLDYLKIDAEGGEQLVLAGAAESISLFRPIIQLEITKGNTLVPEEYRKFSAPGSPNVVLIPAENEEAIGTATTLGWIEGLISD